jgi:predicted ATPase
VAAARDQLEHGIAAYDAERDRSHAHLYGIDPGVVCLSYAGLAWWHLGYPDRAVARTRAGLALAERLCHPQSRALALVWAAWVRQLRREPAEARALAEAAVGLCAEQGFPLWRSMGEILWGWAQAQGGEVEEGVARVSRGLDELAATGAGLWRPSFLALLAEVLVGASRLEEGLRALEQAIEVARRHNELFYEAELERLRGELLGRGKAEVLEIEACFWGAMARAQRQQGRSLELRAASSLARLWREQGKRAEAHDVLAPVYGWFTEGFDAPDLIEANQLLEALV